MGAVIPFRPMAEASLALVSMDVLSPITVVLPRDGEVGALLNAKPLVPFDPAVTNFVQTLGKSLLTDREARRFPELVALGFWARSSNIARLRERFNSTHPEMVRLARGLAFHVAPSNVDTIFVYSLLLSMLAGNKNLVRISSRAGEQSGLLLGVLDRALQKASEEIRSRTAIVRYDHDHAITDALSLRADVRIIWGGDATTSLIRESPLAPHGTELVFPNRYSLAVIDAAAWMALTDKAALARDFVNDALWFGQMACSSPRAVVWRGTPNEVGHASETFWPAIEVAAKAATFPWEDAQAVAKLLAEQDAAVTSGASIVPTTSNHVRVVRYPIETLGQQNAANGGFFCEYGVSSLADVLSQVNRNWQTIASFGVSREDWQDILQTERPSGIDRIVPIGNALDFDAIWDGQDFLISLTRMVQISC